VVKRDYILPIKVSDFYAQGVQREMSAIGPDGPLYKTVFPTNERLDIRLPSEGRDYINEISHMPVTDAPYIVRKYADRVVFLVADECFAHCQYCFRTYKLTSEKKAALKANQRQCAATTLEEKTTTLLNFLATEPSITEVIFTGGEPLTLDVAALEYLFASLSRWRLRLHTRAVVYEPAVITDTLAGLLARYHVRVVLHVNHPYELSEAVTAAIARLYRAGVRLYAQFPLLRGINDHPAVLTMLLERLDECGVRPLTIFCVEPDNYASSFRLPFARVERIIDEVNWRTPSWVNACRFVLDTEIGKVRREHCIKRETNPDGSTLLTFQRDGKQITYPDFPEALDTPSNIQRLLWQQN
jgi:lysine 2,3-aminomutase